MFDIVPLPYLFVNRIAADRSVLSWRAPEQSLRPPAFRTKSSSCSLPARSQPRILNSIPRRSYRMQWNLNIQRQLTRSMALTVGYVGSAGVHLAHAIEDTDQVPASLVTL